jgi:hypothetical protein
MVGVSGKREAALTLHLSPEPRNSRGCGAETRSAIAARRFAFRGTVSTAVLSRPYFRGFLTMAWSEESMESFDPAHSTLVIRSVTVCPRCNGVHIRAIGVDAESTLEWHACGECSFLWGLPRGWTPERAEIAVTPWIHLERAGPRGRTSRGGQVRW